MRKPLSWTQADAMLAGSGNLPFLSRLQEGEDNTLHLTLTGSVTEEDAPDFHCANPALEEILAGCKPIVPDDSRPLEMIFRDYLLYQVRNESYCAFDESEEGQGTYLVQFRKSRLLDYLPAATNACCLEDGSCYPAPWKHYGICTQNHVIDVITPEEPELFCRENPEDC